jgi:enterochelin esterase-like enzyme
VTQHTLRTTTAPLPWEFRVYTPPCYNEHPEARYPLLILIHGSTYTDSQWDDLGADETADTLIASGEIPPFILLMPRDRVWSEPHEDPFGEALVHDILPWVEAAYRTRAGRENRAIGGLSRGASWAVHLGFKYWEQFGAIGGHSLPVFLTDPPRLSAWLDAIPPDSLPRIYIDIGDKDYLLENAVAFETMLTGRNIPHEWHLFTGRHEDAYWRAHLEEYLRWYAAGWSVPPES